MRADDVARALGVHPTTVSRNARAGLIPSVRVGRALRFDLDAVRKALTRSPRPQVADDESEQRHSTGSLAPRTPRGGGRPVPHSGDAGRAEADAQGGRHEGRGRPGAGAGQSGIGGTPRQPAGAGTVSPSPSVWPAPPAPAAPESAPVLTDAERVRRALAARPRR
ncbi:MAG: helix-turn-helix domain-containing protein [Deltaproteobacteria bacterium]|nr:helix-turn-helix domain-containing protein [Deltaproteobacteria bacterium]